MKNVSPITLTKVVISHKIADFCNYDVIARGFIKMNRDKHRDREKEENGGRFP